MRIVVRHSQYMIRLGWLRLIARVVGAESVNRGVLATKLSELAAPNLDTWLDEARLRDKPRGVFSEDLPRRLPGIAERFGIYDIASERLTDLGRVLFLADDAYKEIDSPFAWPRPLRYLGLRILLGADGDILLEILRAWPPEGRLARPLDAIADAASRLLECATDPAEADELRRLAALGTSPAAPKGKAHWQSTYPILEPLRELGYATRVESGGDGGQYVLTQRGAALAAAVRGGGYARGSAESILRESLATLFSTAEGNAVAVDATLEPIRQTLVGLPDMLLGGTLSEAPLEPVVLMTEARLLNTGASTCVEVRSTHALLQLLGRRTGGQVALKQGRMAWEANVAWTSPECLRDPSLFRLDQPDASSFSTGGVVPAIDPPDDPSALLPSIVGIAHVVEEPPAAPQPLAANPQPELIAARESLLRLLRLRLSISLASPAGEAKATEPILAERPALPAPSPVRVIFWLQYVARLLEEPTLGAPDILSAGAPSSWIERLRSLATKPKFLPGKRLPDALPWSKGTKLLAAGAPPAAYLPARWCEELGGAPSARPLTAAVYAWSDMDTGVRLLTVALDRAKETCAGDVAREIRQRIELFLDGEEAGDAVGEERARDKARLLTTAWLEDLIDRNLASREDLKRTLHREANNGLSREVAAAMFAVEGEIKRMTVTHTFQVPSAMVSHVIHSRGRAIVVESPPMPEVTVEPVFNFDDEGGQHLLSNALRVTVEVDASSRALAVTRSEEWASDALKKVRLLAGASEMTAPHGIEADGAPEVMADGLDVPGPEPLKPIAWLSLAPKFPRLALPLITMEELTKAEHPRLSRTLHWLEAADQARLSPAHRISNVWVAMEHIIVEHDEEHGPAVARTLADVGALCRLEALAGYVTRELCQAIRHARRPRGLMPEVAPPWDVWIREHLGQEVFGVIDRRLKGPAPFTDAAALRLLLSCEPTELKSLRDQLADDTPIAAFAIQHFSRNILGTQRDFAVWLHTTRREIQSIVLHAYEIRNLLFHDGVAFGVEDAARLQNLSGRFRLVVDAVVARFATALVRASRRDIAPGELWAKLRIGVRDLLHAAEEDKSGSSMDREALRRALFWSA